MTLDVGRQRFLTVVGAVVAWPHTAHAQPTGRQQRLGVLMGSAESDPEARAFLEGFRQSGAGVARRPEPADRRSLGSGQHRANAHVRKGARGASA
jgi:hypothetical protein